MNANFQEKPDQGDLPIWACDDAFPPASEGFGWIDQAGNRHPCQSLTEISEKIGDDSSSAVQLVWTPDSAFCRVPDEIAELRAPIHEVRKRWAIEDLAGAQHQLKWGSSIVAFFFAYIAYGNWMHLGQIEYANGVDLEFFQKIKWLCSSLLKSTAVGITLMLYLIFALIPWYQAKKYHRQIHFAQSDSSTSIPVSRFETWLSFQKAPATKLIFIAIALVFVAQILSDGSILAFRKSVEAAGLVKSAYLNGDYSRLFTAPLLHGGLLHFFMNATALLYLGKRMEVFARWPHIPTVFLFSALMGGEASARLIETTSVGASGGLMGWLGFLLVFETLHQRLVPSTARRRLLAGLFLTALIGVIGYRFIDNAAHLGGLVAGMIYAGIVFPKSSSPLRPEINIADRVVGTICFAVVFYSSAIAAVKILS